MNESALTASERLAQASEIFSRAWSTYDKVVASNVMRHREMEALLREIFLRRPAPFSLLDLGCGDASMVARALQGTKISHFTGVELVEATTRLAAENLRGVAPQFDFIVGNLLDAVSPSQSGRWDLILASYSVHHLSLAEKGAFFRSLPARLNPGGKFVLIDLMTPPEEERVPFLNRMHTHAERHLTTLTSEEREDIRAHVDANDWPESQATLQRLARDAGFQSGELRYYDPEQFFAMLTFEP